MHRTDGLKEKTTKNISKSSSIRRAGSGDETRLAEAEGSHRTVCWLRLRVVIGLMAG